MVLLLASACEVDRCISISENANMVVMMAIFWAGCCCRCGSNGGGGGGGRGDCPDCPDCSFAFALGY